MTKDKRERNRIVAVFIGLIVGGLFAHFFAIPIINIFFKLAWLGKTIVYSFLIFMGIGLASVILTGHTALNKVAYKSKTKKEEKEKD